MKCALPVRLFSRYQIIRAHQRFFSAQHKTEETSSNLDSYNKIHEIPTKKNTSYKTQENNSNLLDDYDKIQEILTNKNALVQHLCSNVVYEDENIVSMNKPAGLAMKAEKTTGNDARLINHVSLYQTLPELREHFKCPEMNLALPLPRNQSGLIIFGKKKDIVKKLDDKFFRSYANRHLYQRFHLLCVGIPFSQSEDVETLNLRQKEIQNRLMSVPVEEVSVNARRRGEAMIGHFKLNVLSERTNEIKCGYVELLSNTIRWNCCEVFMVQKLSPILGDHTYSSRVAPLLGHSVFVDPELADKGPQKLPKVMLNELGISFHEDDRIKIPLHLHRSAVEIKNFPNKADKSLTISADIPEYFKLALNLLKLDKT